MLLQCGFFVTFLLLASSASLQVPRPSRRLLLQGRTISQFLVPHNRIRAGLSLPPLQLGPALANYAAWWANQRGGDCVLIHTNSNYGENLFWGAGRNWRLADAVGAWAAEGKYYNYWSNSCQPGQDCLHNTQLVWRQSLWVGCARVVCVNGTTFITCNYDPHANVVRQRPY